MFSRETVEKEAKKIFGDVKIRVTSEYFINEDAMTFAIQAETADGRYQTVSLKLSGLEVLQYAGDPADLISAYLQEALYLMKSEATKAGSELVTKEVK
jgi:hypothetical protein